MATSFSLCSFMELMTFLYITNHRNDTFYAIKSLNIGKKEEWLARDTDVSMQKSVVFFWYPPLKMLICS